MHESISNPDGVVTADLCLEHDCVSIESAVNTLRESIANCENPAMLLGTLVTIDAVREALDSLQKQAETKVHSLAFASELFEVA